MSSCSRRRIGPLDFGVGSMVRLPKSTTPGCIAVTELLANDDAAVQRVRELVRQTVIEQLDRPGFLQFTLGQTTRRER